MVTVSSALARAESRCAMARMYLWSRRKSQHGECLQHKRSSLWTEKYLFTCSTLYHCEWSRFVSCSFRQLRKFAQADDPMIGKPVGGVIVSGCRLPPYSRGELEGALGCPTRRTTVIHCCRRSDGTAARLGANPWLFRRIPIFTDKRTRWNMRPATCRVLLVAGCLCTLLHILEPFCRLRSSLPHSAVLSLHRFLDPSGASPYFAPSDRRSHIHHPGPLRILSPPA